MRGFLSLEPDGATLARLVATQNRLRDAIARQGVHFPERLGPTLLAWPFATHEEIDHAAARIDGTRLPGLRLEAMHGRPNDDRPAEVGYALEGAETLQTELLGVLRGPLDPDPPKPAFLRLVRVSPPSRKVGAAFRGSGLLATGEVSFVASSLGLWSQTPTGFELRRIVPLRGE